MCKLIYTDELITEAVRRSKCYSDVIRTIGAKIGGNSYQRVRRKIDELGLDTSHFLDRQTAALVKSGIAEKRHWSEILTAKKTRRVESKTLRRALTESGVPYICCVCGLLPEWCGRPLTIQVDHIDGDALNCQRDNLRFLCPNCHTQTATFGNQSPHKCKDCGKRVNKGYTRCARCAGLAASVRKVKNRPTLETLTEEVSAVGYRETGRKYGVSDNTIRKWLKIEKYKESLGL